MINITFKNGNVCEWTDGQYTDYKYDGKCFILIKNNQYVGIYNIDGIISIVIK